MTTDFEFTVDNLTPDNSSPRWIVGMVTTDRLFGLPYFRVADTGDVAEYIRDQRKRLANDFIVVFGFEAKPQQLIDLIGIDRLPASFDIDDAAKWFSRAGVDYRLTRCVSRQLAYCGVESAASLLEEWARAVLKAKGVAARM